MDHHERIESQHFFRERTDTTSRGSVGKFGSVSEVYPEQHRGAKLKISSLWDAIVGSCSSEQHKLLLHNSHSVELAGRVSRDNSCFHWRNLSHLGGRRDRMRSVRLVPGHFPNHTAIHPVLKEKERFTVLGAKPSAGPSVPCQHLTSLSLYHKEHSCLAPCCWCHLPSPH